MIRRPLAIFIVITLLGLSSCTAGSYAHKPPAIRFIGTTLAKHVAKQGDLAVPVENGKTFSTDEKKVVAHVRFENMGYNYALRWDWYSPDQRLYTSSEELPIKSDTGLFRRTVTAWHAINISGDRASDMPGIWKVKIYVNNDLLDKQQFELASRNAPVKGN